ncbi:MAG: 3-oxoacyl-ACP synthase III family protein [Bryobacteraceae bacterium]
MTGAWLRGFGRHLPERVVINEELAPQLGCDPAWIVQMSGIEERRWAAPSDTVAGLGIRAAQDCLARAGVEPREVDLILVASGSAERRFPGPAVAVGAGLELPGVPAIDLPLASAGSLFGLALAAELCGRYRNVLVVGAEIMSRAICLEPACRDTAILFGDGAGACLVSAETGFARIADTLLASDGAFADALRLELAGPIQMSGPSVIMQATRKVPRAISELLERNRKQPGEIAVYLMHQANRNLIVRTAKSLGVAEEKFFINVGRYGNTSSASMPIAAAEWWQGGPPAGPMVFAAFGAGLNWGAVLAE